MKKISLNLDAPLSLLDKFDSLSRLRKILLCSGLLLVVVGIFIWFFYLPKFEKIGELKKEYAKLEKELTTVKKKAGLLKRYKAEMEKAEVNFRLAKKKLPETKEIPALLDGISQSGQDAGLEFLLFQPKPEIKRDFYAEIPVAIKVVGNFHNTAIFFDKVSKLSRIVNIKNIVMSPRKSGGALNTSCTAVTYKYIEQPAKKKTKGKKKSKRKRR